MGPPSRIHHPFITNRSKKPTTSIFGHVEKFAQDFPCLTVTVSILCMVFFAFIVLQFKPTAPPRLEQGHEQVQHVDDLQELVHAHSIPPRHQVAPAAKHPGGVSILSWNPRVFHYKQFLSDGECNHLMALASGNMAPSTIMLPTGEIHKDGYRTSKQAWVNKSHDAAVTEIEARIATWAMLPVENGEDLQVALYEEGETFKEHYDFFHGNLTSPGGQRVATVIMYLSDVESGGETMFPRSTRLNGGGSSNNGSSSAHHSEMRDDTSWSPCGKIGEVSVKPRKGDAILFFSLTPSAVADYLSLHVGCPVVKGKKWTATKWIHLEPFEQTGPQVATEESESSCVDLSPHCLYWATTNQCNESAAFMIGNSEYPGQCRKSCKVC
jgi:prolyl 4-hydroxylase